MYTANKKKTFVKILVGSLLFITVVPFITMLLWNALVPVIFGLGSITYIQALGLLILSKILFSGFSHIGHRRRADHWRPQPQHIRKFQDKMRKMCEKSHAKDHHKGSFGMNDQKTQE